MHTIIPIPLKITHPEPKAYLSDRIQNSVESPLPEANALGKDQAALRKLTNTVFDGYMVSNEKPWSTLLEVVSKEPLENKKLKNYFVDLSARASKGFQLIDNEIIVNDKLCYLLEPYEGIDTNCFALKRVTNYSEVIFIDPANRFNVPMGELEQVDLFNDKSISLSTSDHNYTEYAQKMAKALAGKAPAPWNKIASKLLEHAWPSESEAEAQWRRAFVKIQEIVKEAVEQGRINNAIDCLKGFIEFHRIRYIPMRDNPKRSKPERLKALKPYEKDFYTEIISKLRLDINSKENYEMAISCLANFLLGANLHIALTQEESFQDEAKHRTEYEKVIKNMVTSYSAYLIKMKDVLIDYRADFVTEVETKCGVTTAYYQFRDTYVNKTTWLPFNKDNSMQVREIINGLRFDCVRKLVVEQIAIFDKNIQPIIDDWEKLKTNPIPRLEKQIEVPA